MPLIPRTFGLLAVEDSRLRLVTAARQHWRRSRIIGLVLGIVSGSGLGWMVFAGHALTMQIAGSAAGACFGAAAGASQGVAIAARGRGSRLACPAAVTGAILGCLGGAGLGALAVASLDPETSFLVASSMFGCGVGGGLGAAISSNFSE